MMPKGECRKIAQFYGNDKESVYLIDDSSKNDSSTEFSVVKNHQQKFERKSGKIVQDLKQTFSEIFLPQGYPYSVTDDYVEYQIWDTLQAFCSSITGALATEAVLKGVGVGDQSATALAATTTWLLKDGAGMIGRIAFAWLKGTELDCFSKQWRLMADILNDLAIFVDFLAPYFKPFFTLVVCFSSCCRAVVGVAGGATRAALTQHQALRNNLADVSAKDGSQETLVNLSALVCSLVLIPLVSGRPMVSWSLFILFTAFHLLANYRAVRSLRMNTFNSSRYRALIRHFLKTGHILPVSRANRLEPVLPEFGFSESSTLSFLTIGQRKKARVRLIFGSSLKWATAEDLQRLMNHENLANRNYFIYWHQTNGYNYSVYVCLKMGSDVKDMLKAAFEAEILRLNIEETRFSEIDLKTVHDTTVQNFDEFLSQAKHCGWNVWQCLLNFGEFRYSVE